MVNLRAQCEGVLVIFCANPHLQYLAHKSEIDRAVKQVLAQGRYVLGEKVKAFEKEFAEYCGLKYGIGVASGTDALVLSLQAIGVGTGDEVITVSHTAVATVAAIHQTGATPVLVDIEPEFYTIDPDKIESAISPKTKAIIPVHLYGQPVDLNPILDKAQEHGLKIIEDCAQAHGAMYKNRKIGSFGDLACFSFYPTKNLGALGDGGMVVTDSPELANQIKLLREYGWGERYVSQIPGMNSRLDELQAAILLIKLGYLDKDNAARVKIAEFYHRELAVCKLTLPTIRKEANHVYHQYVVRTPERDQLNQYLHENGIASLIHYPVPVHLQPAYLGRFPGQNNLTKTEKAANEVLSLPIYPELSEADQYFVISKIKLFFNQTNG